MNETDYRFFLAHDKATPDDTINAWRDDLTVKLSEAFPDVNVTIVAGRDDYQSRAADAGGWKGWPRTVVSGCLHDGSPRFHGIIRPATYVGSRDVICGRPTFEMVDGFMREGKMAWVWDTDTGIYHKVDGTARLPGDDFRLWGRLDVAKQ